jgi:APA family basic amino acid/polyamine antiporter
VTTPAPPPTLAREIGLFGATMLVMGGIVGSGIFMNPYVVARQVGTPLLILAAWAFGGVVALAGAFVYAELASLRPAVGGQYAQSLLMVLKTAAIAGLVAVGFAAFGGERLALRPVLDRPPSPGFLAAFGAALVPVLFAYGGWQTSGFVMGELKSPERDMPRALLLGVAGVVVLYLSVNVVCLRALGPAGLAASAAPPPT